MLALGVSFVLTGSTIAFPIRLVAFHTLGRLQFGPIRMDSLFRCPYCNAWWGGLAIAAFSGFPIAQWLQCAFASCVLAAVVQAQWALAAHEFDNQEEGE